MIAPICLFTYNRLNETKLAIDALKKNFLAEESELFIFSDGYKDESSKQKVEAVRQYLRTVDGFKSVSLIQSEENKGLASSIIKGVSRIVKEYGKVIVLEDDLITSPNFLDFMNQALHYYSERHEVFSIAGYSTKVSLPEDHNSDVFLRGRPTSWGWATWNDRWASVDWELKNWDAVDGMRRQRQMLKRHGSDLFPMLLNHIYGKNDSWAVRFAFSQIHENRFTISPVISKVKNIGFGADATHCKSVYNKDRILFDNSSRRTFHFTEDLQLDEAIALQLKKQSSLRERAKGKILSYLIDKKIINPIDNVENVK
jgi:hypothetical protein